MDAHFCRVGKIKPNLNKLINFKELEKVIANFVDDINKVEYDEGFKTASI